MNPVEVIYSDADIIVLNKPAGLSVHGLEEGAIKKIKQTQQYKPESTLVDFLIEKFPETKTVGDAPNVRPGIVHRLDKNTSGVMVVARTQESFYRLKSLFQNREVEKKYLAIVCGRLREKRGSIRASIGRRAHEPTKMGIEHPRRTLKNVRDAFTEYTVLKEAGAYSLVELAPKTGRMHQLRVHLQSIGHPVACDALYGGKKVCCPQGAGRQLLHAQSISFTLGNGNKMFFEADPPEDFLLALTSL